MIRSFNPIFRISFDSLKHIDEMHSNGWKGHNEVLIPTLLHRKGFKIKDLDNNGNFVGSMRPYWSFICLLFKPKNKLFHPICIGTSRKSFIAKLIGSDDPDDRLAGTIATSAIAIMNGAHILRVHDVKEAVHAARITDRINLLRPLPRNRG